MEAKKAWEEEKAKCDSAVMDLFYGQTVTKVNCSKCRQKQHSYQLFSTLSVPIPHLNEIIYYVIVVRKVVRGRIPPVQKYGFIMPKKALLQDLMNEVEKTCQLPTSLMQMAEVDSSRLYRIFGASSHERNMKLTQCFYRTREIYAFEAPKNKNDFSRPNTSKEPSRGK